MIQDAVPLHVRVQRYGPYLMPPHVGTLMWSPEELKAKEGTTASSLWILVWIDSNAHLSLFTYPPVNTYLEQGMCIVPPSDFCQEKALHLLHKCEYNIQEAFNHILLCPEKVSWHTLNIFLPPPPPQLTKIINSHSLCAGREGQSGWPISTKEATPPPWSIPAATVATTPGRGRYPSAIVFAETYYHGCRMCCLY